MMESFSIYAGFSLPIAILVFVGSISYIGKRKPEQRKLSVVEVIMLFLGLWFISAALIFIFKIMFAGQDDMLLSTVGDLWGPLIVGVVVGRGIVNWRRNISSKKNTSNQNDGS